jgi:hypothetical protein
MSYSTFPFVLTYPVARSVQRIFFFFFGTVFWIYATNARLVSGQILPPCTDWEMMSVLGEVLLETAATIDFKCRSVKRHRTSGAFAKLQNRISASSCLSVRPHATVRLPLVGFSWNLICAYTVRSKILGILFFFFKSKIRLSFYSK